MLFVPSLIVKVQPKSAVPTAVFCADYHTKAEIVEQGDNVLALYGKKKCFVMCRTIGRILSDLATQPFSAAQKSSWFTTLFRGNWDDFKFHGVAFFIII